MDQYDLKHLFDKFDESLGVGRSIGDPKRLRANHFMLISINPAGICLFQHKETRLKVKYDWKTKKIVD